MFLRCASSSCWLPAFACWWIVRLWSSSISWWYIRLWDFLASLTPYRCEEYSFRVADLESRLSLMKRQAQVALDKASKSHGLVRQVSTLEDKLLGLVARIAHFEESESFLLGIVEYICEMLLCKSSVSLFSLFFLLSSTRWFSLEL
jgi:hypothetical protein